MDENHMLTEKVVDFILDELSPEENLKMCRTINKDVGLKKYYLYQKRRIDANRYISDEMDIGERFEFEELLKEDQELNEDFTLRKKIENFLSEMAFRELLQKMHFDIYSPKTDIGQIKITQFSKPKLIRIGKWMAAASIVVLFSAFSLYLINKNRDSVENRIYASYYAPPENTQLHFFSSSHLSEAKSRYYHEEYSSALYLLENLSGSMPIEDEKSLFLGLTLMGLDRHDEAITIFECLSEASSKDRMAIRSITDWYLSLCYLKKGQIQQATGIFEKLVRNNAYKSKEANKILKKLRKH